MSDKPFNCKSYGSIGHLPESRLGPGDHKITEGQARILTVKTRDKRDHIYVEEKLDGSNVGVGKLNGVIIPLVRSGYRAETSPYEQHHWYAAWVAKNYKRFNEMLHEGERLCGECLIQAHGTRYKLHHEPFAAFDLFRNGERILHEERHDRCQLFDIVEPTLLHSGGAYSVRDVLTSLGDHGHHGAIDLAEGAVWRCEREGKVDFLGKYVRPSKKDGIYLPEHGDTPQVWNELAPEVDLTSMSMGCVVAHPPCGTITPGNHHLEIGYHKDSEGRVVFDEVSLCHGPGRFSLGTVEKGE